MSTQENLLIFKSMISLTDSILHLKRPSMLLLDFPGGSGGKASAYSVGDQGSIPGSGRSPGEGHGNPV